MKYREFKIPKKNGKFRKIVAPDEELLRYQRSRLDYLVKLYFSAAEDASVEQVAHGFLPDRNCVTGAARHVGYRVSIMMDISDFFDSVTTEHIRIYSKGVANDKKLFHKEGYAGQGFATSPILANIAIIPALQEIQEYIEDVYPDSAFTIYADDITISTNHEAPEWQVEKDIAEFVTTCLGKYGFTIKPSKTRCRYAKNGFRRILGVNVGETSFRATRKTMRKIRAARHQSNGPSLGGLVTWSRCLVPRNLR